MFEFLGNFSAFWKVKFRKAEFIWKLKSLFFSFLNLENGLKVSINFTEEKASSSFQKSCKSCSSNKQSVTRAVAQINRVVDRTSLAALFRFKIQTSKSLLVNCEMNLMSLIMSD